MTKGEAWRIIEECRGWNSGQTSVSLAFTGNRTAEDDALDARRQALREAWRVVAEDAPESG
jgi:hypothetical protein